MPQAPLAALLQDWRRLLRHWSETGALRRAAREALAAAGEPRELQRLLKDWSAADFQGLPPVMVLPSRTMGAAAGAYARETGTIYLNSDWLPNATTRQVMAVLTEELGHHLDERINPRDTTGDEGELLARLLLEGTMPAAERERMGSERDGGWLEVAGQGLAVEFSSPTISLSLGSGISVLEDGSANLLYTFRRSGALSSSLRVHYTVAGTASLCVDYTGIPSAGTTKSVVFAAGSATATVSVDPTADTTIEANESVRLTLATGTGYTIATTSAVVGTILNDDWPMITLAVAPSTGVSEDGTNNLIYTFSRTGATTTALTVNYTVGGSATLGTDFTGIAATPVTKTVSFAAGSATAIVTVDPTADNIIEPDETISLRLAAGTGYGISTTNAVTSRITNDDYYAILPSSSLIQEGEILTTTVNTAGVATGTTLYWALSGAASSPADLAGGSLTGSGQVASNGSFSFRRGFFRDLLTEGNESLQIRLYSDAALTRQLGTTATVTVQDSSPTPSPTTNITTIRSSTAIHSRIASRGEIDSYAVDVVSGTIMMVSLSSSQSNLFPLIELRNPDGSLLKDSIAYNGTTADLGMVDMLTGKAVINVRTQAGTTGDYTLRVSTTTREEWESEVIRLTNRERQKEGLTVLSRNTLLERAAESHVLDMDARNRYLAHTGSNGSTPVDRIKATGYKGAWVPMGDGRFRTISSENAAAGQLSPLEVVLGWMNSDGHRAAILDPATKDIGVGFEYDNEASRTYWVQNFGHPWSSGMMVWF
jgi:uncharacterized protein YkwD